MASQRARFFRGKKMAKRPKIEPKGNSQEVNLFHDLHGHYSMAKADLEQRIYRKNGFDEADKMFASHIDEKDWPFQSMVYDPRPYTVILEKSARLIGSKPKGRLVPREGGDTLGAYINNELLDFQWEDNARLGESMIGKWIMMDQNARKYGASFAITKWNYTCKAKSVEGKAKKEVTFDGPDFTVCNPRDVLANPSYSFINKWFQHREYVTLGELQNTNDAARTKPVYKNLDILRDALKEDARGGKGDKRDSSYVNKNKSMRGLTDYLGQDEVYKTVEIVTEYRPDRWITFCPRHGVIIRDIPNPYKHGEIPVVMLKYYPLPDELYGMGEFEPVASLLRGMQAYLSQFSDTQALRLYPPLKINPTGVRMNTIEWFPEAKWLMTNTQTDVMAFEMGSSDISAFNTIYNTYVGAILNAWGESSQGSSQVNPTQDAGRVTATEVKDTAFTRNVRDNMNQIFLSEALKKQVMFWHSMNQQLLFQGNAEKNKVIRIVGRDAIEYFNRLGLSDIRPTAEDAEKVTLGLMTEDQIVPGPAFGVLGPDGETTVPKFQPDETGQGGSLVLEQGDLLGSYDYIPDIESMRAPSQEAVEQKLTAILGTITNPAIAQMLAQEGKKAKVSDLLVKMFESTGVIKDAEAYFEDLPQPNPLDVQNTAQPGGAGAPASGQAGQGNGLDPRMAGSAQAMAGI